ncbi:Rv2231c family pyridoxal phosphate-dependent protein CobC [Nocardioides sp. URHA0020]|uniref:Rv2231c family pyridoxal phosphate-dependent protein CobC n=1 Tax=Nocardioides sp. URHA0020 TaxID=1380392 RepID=UPI00048BD604
MDEPLRHHGDAEVRAGMADFAVNVYDGPRPPWLDTALQAGLDAAGRYPSAATAEAALAARHGRAPGDVLATAGAAEAFWLVARLRAWSRPVVVHPQFTEPHAALEQAGHRVTEVVLPEPFVLDPGAVPDDADLVVIGNPTNPTGVLHPRATIEALLRDGRVVVVDEAFMDAVPGEPETLTAHRHPGLVVTRSLTKHWGIPGVRAGYLLAEPALVADLRTGQVPWSVSSSASAAMVACCSREAAAESDRRAEQIVAWRRELQESLSTMGIHHLPSQASFVLARVGEGVHGALRDAGVAVRRADTFPGLDATWVRIAVRPPARTRSLLDALSALSLDALG